MPRPVRESEVLAASLVNSVTQALGKLQNLWDEMGISRELQMERMQAAKGRIETLLNEMIEEESNMKEKIQNDIEMHKHQLDILRHELRQDPYKWEEELLVLEEQKKEHLKKITLKVREELDTYWNKCYFCGEQRATFQPFYNDNYSEELLSLHDEELVKIRAVYEKNKSLYESVQKWEAILERFVELEKKSADPSRLLNRGGSLLRDEKERSKIQKQLLKLEEELKRNIENWEKENGSSFLVNNQRFLDTMAQQLQHHKLKKDHQSKISVKKEEFAASRRTVKKPAEESTPTTNKKMCKVASSLKAFSCSNLSTGTAVGGKQRPFGPLSPIPFCLCAPKAQAQNP
ncbi:protein regulator of cytokinesis 1-like isoform X2 [Anolis carolinensis]|uniref:protein regulator of cytokinesis 1-like isoform X2 n=1 Tax=Anolis carolinensis TaxID=28377 RepID=UPI002F2B4A3B